MVEGVLHPTATVVFSVGDAVLKVGERPARVHLVERFGVIGVCGRKRRGEVAARTSEAGLDVAEAACIVVAARFHDGLRRGIDRGEGVSEARLRVSPSCQRGAGLAHFLGLVGHRHGRQVGVIDRVAADLITACREACQVRLGQVPGSADPTGDGVQSAVQSECIHGFHRCQLVGIRVIEGQADDGLRGGCNGSGRSQADS